jgi:hypothetical protein
MESVSLAADARAWLAALRRLPVHGGCGCPFRGPICYYDVAPPRLAETIFTQECVLSPGVIFAHGLENRVAIRKVGKSLLGHRFGVPVRPVMRTNSAIAFSNMASVIRPQGWSVWRSV